MSDKTGKKKQAFAPAWSRRNFLASTSGLALAAQTSVTGATAPAAVTGAMASAGKLIPRAPFDSLRDFVAAMEGLGNVMRFDRVDQDAYEGTAIMYRLVDLYGIQRTPMVIFENIKINGRWIKGPVVANQLRHVDAEAVIFGLDPIQGDDSATWQIARKHLDSLIAGNNGMAAYPEIPAVELPREEALCKEVALEGDAIDITAFPFFKNNPGDSGRFINTASVFTRDPKMGLNIGTYRCEIKGPRHIALGIGEGQTGHTMLIAAKERGENNVPVTLVVGHEPMVWLVSGARIPARIGKKPVDELAAAGGLRGAAVKAVKCDTNDFLVPAHAEMVIEGTVNFDSFESNGPYGETAGYIGRIYEQAFTMTIEKITHRQDPWITNDFTGVNKPIIEQPGAALGTAEFKAFMPEIVDMRYQDGVVWFSVKKSKPGQALDIGKKIASIIPVYKIVIVVDDDVDLWNDSDRFMAFATRWQPSPASYIFPEMLPSIAMEISAPQEGLTSKIAIDATRQWPEEGGPPEYPRYSRQVLTEYAPEIFDDVDAKWGGKLFGRLG